MYKLSNSSHMCYIISIKCLLRHRKVCATWISKFGILTTIYLTIQCCLVKRPCHVNDSINMWKKQAFTGSITLNNSKTTRIICLAQEHKCASKKFSNNGKTLYKELVSVSVQYVKILLLLYHFNNTDPKRNLCFMKKKMAIKLTSGSSRTNPSSSEISNASKSACSVSLLLVSICWPCAAVV